MELGNNIKDNLVALFTHGGCSIEQVEGFAANYVLKGFLTQEQADEVSLTINPPEVDDLIQESE